MPMRFGVGRAGAKIELYGSNDVTIYIFGSVFEVSGVMESSQHVRNIVEPFGAVTFNACTTILRMPQV